MVLAAVGQFCATNSLAQNAQSVCTMIKNASMAGAKALFLPEASDYLAGSTKESLSLVQSADQSVFLKEIMTTLQSLPNDRKLSVSVGIHEPASDDRVRNTLLWLNPDGNIAHRYQKIHLFDVDIANGPILKESRSVEPGSSILAPFDSPLGKIGAAICYDIRFPELALRLRSLGAEVLLYPSAFTVRTGQAHWRALARARAIDNQCYVIMSAQVGTHDEAGKRQSYGHAMVVDPWGTVLAEAPDLDSKPRIILADIDLEHLQKVRRDMPLWEQRRPDVFGYNI